MGVVRVRTCSECGEKKKVTYIPKGHEKCPKCIGKEMSKNKYKNYEKVKYVYFCRYCSKVNVREKRRKHSRCGDCSRKYAKIKQFNCEFDFNTMKNKRPPTVIIERIVKKVSKKVTSVNKFAIEEQRVLNKKHRSQEMKLKVDKKVKKQVLSDEEMIANYLKNNKVTVILPSTGAVCIMI